MIESSDENEIKLLEKKFKEDIKSRIDETAKYIKPQEKTLDYAFMFIPADGLYQDLLNSRVGSLKINSNELVSYAYLKKVMIVSPMSLFPMLQITMKALNNLKFEKEIDYNISKDQKFIEYSLVGADYLKKVAEIVKKNNGGLLMIDYGYMEKRMKNTLKSISNHKHNSVLKNIGTSDITHNINFFLFKKIINQLGGLKDLITTQGSFLVKLGIKNRAEIISQNQSFSKKADIYFRLKKLIDEKEMGNLFKVMFIKNKGNKYKLGFN